MSAAQFDWSELHDVLDALPAGRWTSYGDLAELVGTAPRALGTHVARCTECTNAWRVLGGDGRARCRFHWGDPSERRTQADVLAIEGVRFPRGAADPSQRLTPPELLALSERGVRHRRSASTRRRR